MAPHKRQPKKKNSPKMESQSAPALSDISSFLNPFTYGSASEDNKSTDRKSSHTSRESRCEDTKSALGMLKSALGLKSKRQRKPTAKKNAKKGATTPVPKKTAIRTRAKSANRSRMVTRSRRASAIKTTPKRKSSVQRNRPVTSTLRTRSPSCKRPVNSARSRSVVNRKRGRVSSNAIRTPKRTNRTKYSLRPSHSDSKIRDIRINALIKQFDKASTSFLYEGLLAPEVAKPAFLYFVHEQREKRKQSKALKDSSDAEATLVANTWADMNKIQKTPYVQMERDDRSRYHLQNLTYQTELNKIKQLEQTYYK